MNKLIDAVNHLPVSTKVVADVSAVGFAWGAFFSEVIPAIAAVLSVVWFTLQIYAWIINKKWKRVE